MTKLDVPRLTTVQCGTPLAMGGTPVELLLLNNYAFDTAQAPEGRSALSVAFLSPWEERGSGRGSAAERSRASSEGWRPAAKTLKVKIPERLPNLAGFSMVGQWTAPFADLPTVVMNRRNAIAELCAQDDREFTGGKPGVAHEARVA